MTDGMQLNGYWTELEARMMETMALFYLHERKDNRSYDDFCLWLQKVDSWLVDDDERYTRRMWAHVVVNWDFEWRKGA